MRQTEVMIADCLSHIVCQNTAENDETHAHADWVVGIVKEVYTKCGDNFVLGQWSIE